MKNQHIFRRSVSATIIPLLLFRPLWSYNEMTLREDFVIPIQKALRKINVCPSSMQGFPWQSHSTWPLIPSAVCHRDAISFSSLTKCETTWEINSWCLILKKVLEHWLCFLLCSTRNIHRILKFCFGIVLVSPCFTLLVDWCNIV